MGDPHLGQGPVPAAVEAAVGVIRGHAIGLRYQTRGRAFRASQLAACELSASPESVGSLKLPRHLSIYVMGTDLRGHLEEEDTAALTARHMSRVGVQQGTANMLKLPRIGIWADNRLVTAMAWIVQAISRGAAVIIGSLADVGIFLRSSRRLALSFSCGGARRVRQICIGQAFRQAAAEMGLGWWLFSPAPDAVTSVLPTLYLALLEKPWRCSGVIPNLSPAPRPESMESGERHRERRSGRAPEITVQLDFGVY
ncbi:hypothetical protein SCUP234_02574 [Seiridium cupressi]